MKLFKEKIKDILCREEISTKYSNFQPYENRYNIKIVNILRFYLVFRNLLLIDQKKNYIKWNF